jgi:endonuclease G, mitochondrial
VQERGGQRAARLATLAEPGGIGRADAPERVAARLDRLSRYWARAPRPDAAETVPAGSAEDVVTAAIKRGMAWGEPPTAAPLEAAGAVLEKIVGTADFVGINYLETGVIASRAVGRVNVGDASGHVVAYGTGSLVAPRVLLTNHHVLPDADTARTSAIELDFEDGPDGQPRQSHRFPLAPGALFFADEGLDFAIVAVDPGPGAGDALAPYGYNPIVEAVGKAIVGEFVTIVQHPRGERKQVALRENKIVDVLDDFLHYEADTEPGSSGSLVFNDQWETVALHHAGVPDPARQATGGFINEGIRISRVLARLGELTGGDPGNPLLGPVLKPGSDRPVEVAAVPSTSEALEKVEIDPDYANRKGYDADFLGSGKHSVPLPDLSPTLLSKAATRTDGGTGPSHILPYHHFSLAMNKERRLAFFTAVNIDGALAERPKREDDQWSLDPRIASDEQIGEPLYKDAKHLDRGHLVRRLDPAWGDSPAVIKTAIDDTFHFTNCSPQHEKFNRNATFWAGLEEYVLEHADNEKFKVNVFSGPVLSDDDEVFDGVKLPKQFWKVVVMAKSPGLLSATAYLLSQASLIEGMEEVAVEFSYGAFRTYQVQVAEIERLTGLSFGSLPDFDPLGARETTGVTPREVVHESAVIL